MKKKEEIFAIEINNKYYYGNSYEEIRQILTNKFKKEISIDFVWDVFNSTKENYI